MYARIHTNGTKLSSSEAWHWSYWIVTSLFPGPILRRPISNRAREWRGLLPREFLMANFFNLSSIKIPISYSKVRDEFLSGEFAQKLMDCDWGNSSYPLWFLSLCGSASRLSSCSPRTRAAGPRLPPPPPLPSNTRTPFAVSTWAARSAS